MYPGTASNRNIPVGKTKVLQFKETREGEKILTPEHKIPNANISETSTEYRIVMATSGLQREDFNIEIAQSVITISAKKETTSLCCVNDRCEYDYSDWTRAFGLPADADGELARAEYQNGELTIHIPRSNNSENQSKATIYVY